MEYKEIQDLIKLVSKHDLGEVRIQDENFKITIRNKDYNKSMPLVSQAIAPASLISAPPMSVLPATPAEATPATPAVEQNSEKTTPAAEQDANLITFKSPMIGTFYRSPSPDKPPFVKVGDVVAVGQVLCTVEAMKLFNEIESEVSGKIVKVLAENSGPVEYDTPLFLIEPN